MRRSSEPHPVSGRHSGQRDPLVGTWLDDRYLIEERIATGGFGAVYRARTTAGAPLALKVLHPSLTADPNAVARFEREGATLTRLHDPHTVTTLAVGEAGDGTRYIAMELLAGESLQARLLRERTLPWQTAVAIARAVCSSLAEAHALGVIHRDLKPDNLCVEQCAGAERVKVIDFGIVKLAPGSAIDDGQELTCAGHMIGTYDYMSPEQIVGGTCDAASDLYSLGVVLYEMLTGQRPFARLATPAALMTALLTQTPQPPSVLAAIPPALDRIVMRCLEREPAHRFSSAVELAAALERLLAHRLTAREEITAVHPMCPGALRAAPSCATWNDDGWSLRSPAGEDAAICRDLGATLVDDDRVAPIDRSLAIAPRWTDPSRIDRFRSAAKQGSESPCGEGPPCGDPRGIPAILPARSSAAAVAPSAPVPAPAHRTARGSARALDNFGGGATLPGVAVATERRSEPRVAEPAATSMIARSWPCEAYAPASRPSSSNARSSRCGPAALAWLASPAAPPGPSAEVMLAPSIPATPLIRLATGSRPVRPAPSSGAAVLICAALVAAVASFLVATLL